MIINCIEHTERKPLSTHILLQFHTVIPMFFPYSFLFLDEHLHCNWTFVLSITIHFDKRIHNNKKIGRHHLLRQQLETYKQLESKRIRRKRNSSTKRNGQTFTNM